MKTSASAAICAALVCPVENCITMERVDHGIPAKSWEQRNAGRSSMTTLIRNGTVVTADRERCTADILIEGERIKDIGAQHSGRDRGPT